jgi:hypothetical protein
MNITGLTPIVRNNGIWTNRTAVCRYQLELPGAGIRAWRLLRKFIILNL